MKNLIYLFVVATTLSCVPQSEYNRLKTEKEELEENNDYLASEVTRLNQKAVTLEDEISDVQEQYSNLLLLTGARRSRERQGEKTIDNIAPYVSEAEAIRYIEDHYSFYRRGTKYRDIKLRRKASNVFLVSLEECTSKVKGSDMDLCAEGNG